MSHELLLAVEASIQIKDDRDPFIGGKLRQTKTYLRL
jgi:hypothetical protein